MLTKLNDMDILMEDSIDGPPSVGSGEHPVAISTPSTSTPATAKKVCFYTCRKLHIHLFYVLGVMVVYLLSGAILYKFNTSHIYFLNFLFIMESFGFNLQQKIKYKLVSGYILYSRAHRKGVVANNPDSNFGDISRIVGNEWRSLSASEKAPWEEKATKMNEEIKLRGEAVTTTSEETCTSPAPVHPDQVIIFMQFIKFYL